MGNCVSFQLSCDQTVNSIFKCLCGKGYIRTLKENLKALKREFEDLKAIQDEVQNKVTRDEETGHRQKLEAVKVWLERVNSIDKGSNNLLTMSPIQLRKLVLCGLCSKNVYSSYKYGEKVFLLMEEVKKLKSEGNFEVVTEPTLRPGVEERPTRPTIGHEIMLEQAWNRLMEDEVGIMGLHGMGGVGKTTLFKKINNKFLTEKADQFDVVIWVVVSKGAMISKLQEDLAKKLQLFSEVWLNKNESDKAADLHKVLKGKRFVLMLDDIWEEVDLEAIGIPFPTRENGCKVAFTSRSREVCGRMGDHEPMQVKCLEPEEAWELFENMIGSNTFRSDPIIEELAKKVSERCGGLPLALNVIGKTMASKTTVQEWEHAVDVLVRSAAEFSDIRNTILSILKYSYDNLEDENIKSCFLYCALFPESDPISKEALIEFWICEGFMGGSQVIKRATNKGYEILGTLVRANLLMAVGTLDVVMHDVVREMALWIASDFVVQTRAGLCEVPELKNWGDVRRMSLMENKIEEITCGSKCSELTTLFLQKNNLKDVSGEFIQSMQKLVVLDLSENPDFKKLPEQISGLVSLKFLNLSTTSIDHLPVGFQELKKLTHLMLNTTTRLCSISGISKLSSLRILDLQESNVHGDVSLVKELQLLKHLEVLNITISTELGLEQILCDQRLANCINSLKILGFQQKPFNILLLLSMENLRHLCVENSHVSEIITDMKSKENTSPCFSNLSAVEIKGCNSIKDLTWLLFAPNLVVLFIQNLKEVEEIINKEKETNLKGIITTPFQKLEMLMLESLPKLESIYRSPLPFPFLLVFHANDCPKLRKFPFNASSAPIVGSFQIELSPRDRIEWEDVLSHFEREDDDPVNTISQLIDSMPIDLEWEDEDTKNRFMPMIMTEALDPNLISLVLRSLIG